MSDVKILRLSTGEDVIAKIVTETPDTITLSKAFVIIPRQSGPGQQVQQAQEPPQVAGISSSGGLAKNLAASITEAPSDTWTGILIPFLIKLTVIITVLVF